MDIKNDEESKILPIKKDDNLDVESEKCDCDKELEDEKKKTEEYLNNWKRAEADFINYKKRQSELFADLANAANFNIVLEILPIYDTFCLAVQHIPEDIKNTDWAKGVIQLKIQLENLLQNKGLEEIKSVGEKFNPEFHEAVEMINLSAGGEKPEGEILEETQKGYTLNGVVVRTAKVKVAKSRNQLKVQSEKLKV